MHENRWEQVKEVLKQFPECQQSLQVGIASVAHVRCTKCCHLFCSHACLSNCAVSYVCSYVLSMLHAQEYSSFCNAETLQRCQATLCDIKTDPLATRTLCTYDVIALPVLSIAAKPESITS